MIFHLRQQRKICFEEITVLSLFVFRVLLQWIKMQELPYDI